MLKNDYVTVYDKIHCSKLPEYQALYLKAKSRKRGLFKEVSTFLKMFNFCLPQKQKTLANN